MYKLHVTLGYAIASVHKSSSRHSVKAVDERVHRKAKVLCVSKLLSSVMSSLYPVVSLYAPFAQWLST
jgi:hypothetical protein